MRTMESGLCIELFKQSRRRRWRICNLKSVFALFQTSVPLFQIGQFVKCRWIFLELSSKRHWGRLYERKWAAAYVRRKRNYFYGYGLHKTRTARINDSRFSSPLDRSNGDVVCFCTSHDFQQWLERSKLRNDWLRSGNSHILRYFFSFKFIFRSRLLCGAVQLNLCGNLDENFVSDQSGGMKEMFQQMDEVEFRQYFRLSLSHFPATAPRVSRLWRSGIQLKREHAQHLFTSSAKSRTTIECINEHFQVQGKPWPG